jgi:hypothetical protein
LLAIVARERGCGGMSAEELIAEALRWRNEIKEDREIERGKFWEPSAIDLIRHLLDWMDEKNGNPE